MCGSERIEEVTSNGGQWFATTHWSVILAASSTGSPKAREALEQLCRSYWDPIYAYLRRQGHDTPDAQDITQAFFAHLLEHRFPQGLVPQKGKCRSFLLTALRHFVSDRADYLRAQRRGGGRPPISIDAARAEARYELEPVHHLTAEKLYERQWAITLLNHVLDRLQREFAESGKGTLFEQLQPMLLGEKVAVGYAELAPRLGLSEGALKVAVHRMRRRYQALLREEVAHTVAEPQEIDEEIRHLRAVISQV